jgi:carbohydrate kinase (thermoresistant glucokinase family)
VAGARRIGCDHLFSAEAVLPGVRLVYLKGSPDLIRQRMAARHGHFMPPALLDSQFAILEEPSPDENPIVIDVGGQPQQIAHEIACRLRKFDS